MALAKLKLQKVLSRSHLLSILLLGLLDNWSYASLTVIQAGKLLDVEKGRVIANQYLVIAGDRIQSIGAKEPKVSGPITQINLSKATVLPGLIDCHTHLTSDPKRQDPLILLQQTAPELAFRSIPFALKTLQAGFTTVRDVGTYRAFVDLALRDAIQREDIIGPRVLGAGAYLTISGGGGTVNGLAPDILVPLELRFGVADGPEEVRKKVRELAAQGVDLIKILATGAVLSHSNLPGAIESTYAEMKVAVDEAKFRGLRVAAHAHGAEGIRAAIRAGVASIEHGTFLDDEAIRLMKKFGTYLVADIYDDDFIMSDGAKGMMPADFIERNQGIGELQRKNFRKAVLAGVKIAYGTDSGVYPHGDNAKQFAYMVKYGMTPAHAIQSATLDAARLIGKEDQLGSLAVGKLADIIAVENNPLENVGILENVKFVMKAGKVVKNQLVSSAQLNVADQ